MKGIRKALILTADDLDVAFAALKAVYEYRKKEKIREIKKNHSRLVKAVENHRRQYAKIKNR